MHQGCVRSRQRRREGAGGVVADIAKLSVGREEYYTRELATDHEQYLSGHGESPGRWYGAGATTLGLQGEASPAGFQAMFEGRDPTTGQLLGRPHGRNAVPAFDVVLRPTKSVSILYGLGDSITGRAVLAAHHAGLAEAVAYLDEHLGARRGHGGVQHVSGQGLWATATNTPCPRPSSRRSTASTATTVTCWWNPSPAAAPGGSDGDFGRWLAMRCHLGPGGRCASNMGCRTARPSRPWPPWPWPPQPDQHRYPATPSHPARPVIVAARRTTNQLTGQPEANNGRTS
jgi:TrwC relaxase